MENAISIRCAGSRSLDLNEINEFQGDLKDLSKENYERLKNIILKHGYSFATHVWQNPEDGKWMTIDGHQRTRVLKMLRDEGFFVPPLPVVEVQADSWLQAKEKILAGTSQYGEMTDQGLYEFMSVSGIDNSFLDDLRFPELDIEKWKDGYQLDNTSAELDLAKFDGFNHTCPKCGFEWNENESSKNGPLETNGFESGTEN